MRSAKTYGLSSRRVPADIRPAAVNKVGEGYTIAHDAPPRDQHAHGGWSLEHRQRISGSARLYGLKANLRQHVGREHTDERVSLRDEDG
jgi:hypothetical protein